MSIRNVDFADITEDENELIRQLQEERPDAWNDFMNEHRESLHRFIYRYVQDQESASDILQQTFLKAFLGIGRFRPHARLSTWIRTIALRLCYDHTKSKAHRQARVTESMNHDEEVLGTQFTSSLETPATLAVMHEDASRLQVEIDALPRDLKSALILHRLEGYSQKECAQILGVTPKAVETRVHRARKILREKLRKS